MILEKQEFHLTNLISQSRKVTQNEFLTNMEKLKRYSEENNFCVKNFTSVTYSIVIENGEQVLDNECIVEFETPVLQENLPEEFNVKNELLITNAVNLSFKGNQSLFISKYNEITGYLSAKKLQPITPLYTVTHYPFSQEENTVDLDFYIGINPNIL